MSYMASLEAFSKVTQKLVENHLEKLGVWS
jgi:hypothetical protein